MGSSALCSTSRRHADVGRIHWGRGFGDEVVHHRRCHVATAAHFERRQCAHARFVEREGADERALDVDAVVDHCGLVAPVDLRRRLLPGRGDRGGGRRQGAVVATGRAGLDERQRPHPLG
jgi:hypothetical protein